MTDKLANLAAAFVAIYYFTFFICKQRPKGSNPKGTHAKRKTNSQGNAHEANSGQRGGKTQ